MDVVITKSRFKLGLKGQPPIIDVRLRFQQLCTHSHTRPHVCTYCSRVQRVTFQQLLAAAGRTQRHATSFARSPASDQLCVAALQGDFSEPIKPDDCMWNIVDDTVEVRVGQTLLDTT